MLKISAGASVGLNSSALARVAYDDHRQHLHVEFRDGSAYLYLGVTSTIYQELLNAESPGVYLNRRIRNAYTSVRQPALG